MEVSLSFPSRDSIDDRWKLEREIITKTIVFSTEKERDAFAASASRNGRYRSDRATPSDFDRPFPLFSRHVRGVPRLEHPNPYDDKIIRKELEKLSIVPKYICFRTKFLNSSQRKKERNIFRRRDKLFGATFPLSFPFYERA